MEIHLDAIGGVAGDMFIAAVLDAFPHLRDGMLASIGAAGLPPDTGLLLAEHRDHALTGLRFTVDDGRHRGAKDHRHTSFREIREMLLRAPLDEPVREHAIGIFTLLAEVEGKVHGEPSDDVSFHELGEWDTIADVVGAAYLVSKLDARWSVGALPLGKGRVETAHGWLPVPSPATVLLLQGFEFRDDGVAGERVTPTGAAILKYLRCAQELGPGSRRLICSGTGFGTRTLPGLSNVLRVLAFEPARFAAETDRVAQIVFEVDDQTPEDLSIALDKLRAHRSVIDVMQSPALGKKGRITAHVQILADPADLEAVCEACFSETTTLGVRYHVLERRKLERSTRNIDAGGRTLRVKVAQRPHARTAKVEADDLLNVAGDRAERESVRHQAESASLRHKD